RSNASRSPSGKRSMASRMRRPAGVRPVSLLAGAGTDSSHSSTAAGCSSKKPFQKSGGLVEELKLFAGLPAQAKAPGADDTGRQLLESEEVGPLPLIALHQPAEVPKPAMRPLDHKTCVPQAAAVFAAPHGQQRTDTPRQHQG